MITFLQRIFGYDKTSDKSSGALSPQLIYPAEFASENPPDWIIEFEGDLLPRGGHYSTRIKLWGGERGEAIVVVPGSSDGTKIKLNTSLHAQEIDLLNDIFATNAPSSLVSVESGGVDGMPIRVALYRREPALQIEATCNLFEWMCIDASPPLVAKIGKAMWDIALRTDTQYRVKESVE
ncbi:MAG: hypothetical protein AB1489_42680 [Acidobacteriota bacterium]